MTVQTRLRNFAEYYKKHGLLSSLRFSGIKLRAAAARNDIGWRIAFRMNPFVKAGEFSDYAHQADQIWTALRTVTTIRTEELEINVQKFRNYIDRADYRMYGRYYDGGDSGDSRYRSEKLLEHFISFELLNPKDGETFVDVAGNTSPVKNIVRHLYGANSYSMDLKHKLGINGDEIGCDASATGLPDEFADCLSLHCAYEHFAAGSDIGFLLEAQRILKPGGRICIVPLYLLGEYSIRQDPTLDVSLSIRDKEGASIVWVRDYNVAFGRFYDIDSLVNRVVANCGPLEPSIVRLKNIQDLTDDNYYAHFALMLRKPVMESPN